MLSKLVLLGLVLAVTVGLGVASWPTITAQTSLGITSVGGANSGGKTLTSGVSFTLTSLAGGYRVVGGEVNGSASGALTLLVTGVFHNGYTLSITGGSLVVGGQTYSVTSGEAQLGVHGRYLSGQCTLTTAGSQAEYTVLLAAKRVAGINGTPYYTVHLDLVVGQTEYLVTLLAQAQQ
ncbi:hypothetical protein B9Q06_11860 [Candidatus Marsarchaeota G2 archaeon ECH_B_2]|jgi:hypothetical protein|uniref:Uncharacterized protein n=3 Tax=Candidatus Marsarchaeota group 2 TaxID=2203771 RepID=A0A2R6B4F3_9ARCH|nr:MAG: hypothetical protein B9Q06_11860 [Candidatus Marsarchaeota G2 archaeon ECH_B_2]PSN97966.1 MAG: hypothetical protein B9Q07_11060 [Candidatus Marsarchaeota G2 archaeon ECH_B_3]PSN99394.1 MAG: hypothetical protein B9Q05_11810 [Candidatus Marsarchaeota G2 archaeon ECH_B_1]